MSPERRRHLLVMPAYLETAGLDDRLHELLRAEIALPPDQAGASRANLWYRLWIEAGELTGFDDDVRRAWRAAERTDRAHSDAGQPSRHAGLGMRYVLVLASLNSRVASFPPALLATLVRTREWSETRALAVARRMPDPAHRARALAALAPFVGRTAWEEAVAVARSIDGPEERAEAMVGLARACPADRTEAFVGEALELAGGRGRLLARLAASGDRRVTKKLDDYTRMWRSDDHLVDRAARILDVASEAPDAFRARVVKTIVQSLETYDYFLPRLRKAGDVLARVCAMTPDLDEELSHVILGVALEKATRMKDGVADRALAIIARRAPPDQLHAVETAARACAPRAAGRVLSNLALRVRELGDAPRALELAEDIADPDRRTLTLAALSADLPPASRAPLLVEVRALDYGSERTEALLALAPYLDEPQRSQAIAAAADSVSDAIRTVFYSDDPVRFFSQIAPAWPEPVARAAIAAAVASGRDTQGKALRGLGRVVPDALLGEVVDAAAALDAPDDVSAIFDVIADRLPAALLRHSAEAVERIGDTRSRAAALAALAPWSPERLLAAGAVAEEPSFEAKTELALATVHQLRTGRTDAAARLARDLLASARNADYALVGALEPAARSLGSADLLAFIGNVSRRSDRVRVLVGALPGRPEGERRALYNRALAESRWVIGKHERANSLAHVVAAAPELVDASTRRRLQRRAQRVRDDGERWNVVSQALDSLPREWAADLTRRAIEDRTVAIERERRPTSQALIWLAKVTHTAAQFGLEDAIGLLVTVVSSVEDDSDRGELIKAIVPALDHQTLAHLDEPAARIRDDYSRGGAQAAIAARRAQLGDGRKALIEAESISFDTQRAHGVGLVARHLPAELLREIKPDGRGAAEIRAGIAIGLARAGEHEEALKIAKQIRSTDDRVRTVKELFPMLPEEHAEEAAGIVLEAVRDWRARERAEQLVGIVSQVPPASRTRILLSVFEAAYGMRDQKLGALDRLFGSKSGDGVTILRTIAPHLPDLPPAGAREAWSGFLEKVSDRSREAVLADLRAVVPLLAAVGGQDAVEEVFEAIQDIGRWWP